MRSSHTNAGSASPLLGAVSSDAPLAERVGEMMKSALKIASRADEPMTRRLISIGLLGNAKFSEVGEKLQGLIDPQQPSEIQIAAVRALGQMADPAVGPALVKREHWTAYTQPVKDAVLAMILGQPQLVDALLAAIEKGDLPPTSVNPEKRNQLMKHKDEAISQRATALFKDLKPGDRMKVYEDYKSILSLTPNTENGHQIFTKTCTPCHVFSGEGHAVGPDLTGIRNQPGDVLLLHIIVPEFEIMPIYTQYNVETKDGRSVSGILAAETPSSVTLKQALGVQEQVQRSNIASMTSSSLSLMPQELEKTMSKQDLADLVGYLKSGN
jgi:putative heme-binding domain-containing protein